MERYLTAAQQILIRAIVTPDLPKTSTAAQMLLAATNPAELSVLTSIYLDGDYDVRVAVASTDLKRTLALKVDGATSVPLKAPAPRGPSRSGAVRTHAREAGGTFSSPGQARSRDVSI